MSINIFIMFLGDVKPFKTFCDVDDSKSYIFNFPKRIICNTFSLSLLTSLTYPFSIQ